MIRELTTDRELRDSVPVIRDSFTDVADSFGLNRDNCPTHPSFQTIEGLRRMRSAGLLLFGLFAGEIQIGFMGIEKANPDLYYIERLAVIPGYRHLGYGSKLVEYALDRIVQLGGKTVSIGIISDSTVLKKWYEGFGFVEKETRCIAGLPFEVCFLELSLGANV